MSASSAASSSLSRARAAVLVAAAIATAYATYQLISIYSFASDSETLPGAGLHRSNAVYRRRRRGTGTAENPFRLDLDDDDQVENTIERLTGRTLTDGETVVDDGLFQEEYGWANMPSVQPRNGQNIVQLLFRVSEDATRRNAYVHRGCGCDSCGVLPIRGVRYRCANCADFDLCESCESQGLHIKTHIFYKVRVPAPSFGPRNTQPVWYSGDPDSVMRVLPREILTKLARETGFERMELDAYWEQWTFMANTDWRDDPDDINLAMDRKTFDRCLVPSGSSRRAVPSLIFDRMFNFYDTNKDDLIGFPEFLHGIAYRKKKDKWRKIYEGYDIDNDGYTDRKDFLRMFRSYYVLSCQMHRDMLEGTEEQQMSSTDALRHVNSRQPLSGAFGMDGRYPRAPDPRTGEGKMAQSNGDLDIIDGKGVMNESSHDTGNREEIFRGDNMLRTRAEWEHEGRRVGPGYYEALLNPPTTLEQLPAVLDRIEWARNSGDEVLMARAEYHAHTAQIHGAQFTSEEARVHSSDSDNEFEPSGMGDEEWPPEYVNVTDEDAEAIDGLGTTVESVKKSSRKAVTAHAFHREKAERAIHDRWQRRHFYTDEEEGASPPDDWKDDEDVLALNGIMGESSKASTRPITHSRSSSRVRFAEDMDDFDTRSNPSTSSRSVPERWGGIDIPDAERDAGKEILYQVTQQAFNELLNPLFRSKEDLALEAATTKEEREKYRHFYQTPEFEEWASSKESKGTKSKKEPANFRSQETTLTTETLAWQPLPQLPEVEVPQLRQRPLEELLASTGYTVSPGPDSAEVESLPDLQPISMQDSVSGDHVPISEGSSSREALEASRVIMTPPPTTPTEEVLSIIAQYDDDSTTAMTIQSTPTQITRPRSIPDPSEYRDPTLPQFRPNSTADIPRPNPATDFLPLIKEEDADVLKRTSPLSILSDGSDADTDVSPIKETEEEKPDQEKLFRYWQLDKAAKEAEERGGWGRISYAEFEEVVKSESGKGEAREKKMDYLGSWIEFCIP